MDENKKNDPNLEPEEAKVDQEAIETQEVKDEAPQEEVAEVKEEAPVEEAPAEEVVETAPVAEEAPIEEAKEETPVEEVAEAPAEEPVKTQTAEEFAAENEEPKDAPAPAPKKKKNKGLVIGLSVGIPVGIILIVVIALAAFLFGGYDAGETIIKYQPLSLNAFDMTEGADPDTYAYYIGNQNDADLSEAFGEGAQVDINGTGLATIAKDEISDPMSLSVTIGGETKDYTVYVVDAYNLQGDDAVVETKMREKLAPQKDESGAVISEATSVCLHKDLTTVTGQTFAIACGHVYGNSHELHADSIAAPRNQKKNSSSWGSPVFALGEDTYDGYKELHIQDLHIFVNTPKEGQAELKLEDYEFSGSGIDISADDKGDGYEGTSTLKNVICENGQKLLHIGGANVIAEGCIFRNGADANIASGTRGNKTGSNVTLKNCVSSNSMVTGFLFYGYEKVKDEDYRQQTLNIEGFFDIYNWKSTDTAKLVPSTENGALPVADLVNKQVGNEIKNPAFAQHIYKLDGVDYIHIGIIRLSTGDCKVQNPTINYRANADEEFVKINKVGADGKPSGTIPEMQYEEKGFPIPNWAMNLGILQNCNMIAFKSNWATGEKPYIMPGTEIPDTIFHDMAYGRGVDAE